MLQARRSLAAMRFDVSASNLCVQGGAPVRTCDRPDVDLAASFHFAAGGGSPQSGEPQLDIRNALALRGRDSQGEEIGGSK